MAIRVLEISSLLLAERTFCECSVTYQMAHLDTVEPIVVAEDVDGELTVADGLHRVEAAKRLGRSTIRADVYPGSKYDAGRFPTLGWPPR